MPKPFAGDHSEVHAAWTGGVTPAWYDRTYRLKHLGEYTSSNYDFFVQSSVSNRLSAFTFTLHRDAEVVVISEDAGPPSLSGWSTCTSPITYDLWGHAAYSASTDYSMDWCRKKDFTGDATVSVPGSNGKKLAFVKYKDAPTAGLALTP